MLKLFIYASFVQIAKLTYSLGYLGLTEKVSASDDHQNPSGQRPRYGIRSDEKNVAPDGNLPSLKIIKLMTAKCRQENFTRFQYRMGSHFRNKLLLWASLLDINIDFQLNFFFCRLKETYIYFFGFSFQLNFLFFFSIFPFFSQQFF